MDYLHSSAVSGNATPAPSPSVNRFLVRSLKVAASLVALVGCAGQRPPAEEGFPETRLRRESATPLRQVAVSSPEASLTSAPHLDVDSRGRIYVSDTYQNRVSILNPDGSLRGSVGRRGSGPGEFQSVQTVQVLPGDSLLVYDPELARVSVFAPDSARAAYTVNLASSLQGPAPWHLWRTPDNRGFLALFRPIFAFVPGADFSSRRDRARLLELDGSLRRELGSWPSKEFLIAGNSITPHPFGREPFVRADSDGNYFAVWGDTLGAIQFDGRGEQVGGFKLDYSAPAVTSRDVEAALGGDDEFRAALAAARPERWPAATNFLIDDLDRLWFALGGPADAETEWVAFTREGTYLGSLMAPAGTSLRLIRSDGRVYATRLGDDHVPSVVVLQMQRPLR